MEEKKGLNIIILFGGHPIVRTYVNTKILFTPPFLPLALLQACFRLIL